MSWWAASEAWWLILLTSVVVCGMVSLSLALRRKLPPGPPALPVIGHLHLLGKSPHRSLCDLSKAYGPLMFLRLGSVPLIVASTPAMAKQILQTHDQAFTSRVVTAAVDAVYGSCQGITFSDAGPYWKFLRQLCATDLFSARRMESYKPIRMEEVGTLLRSVLADSINNNRNLVSVRPLLQTATNNIISRMAVGQLSTNILQPVTEAMEALGAVNLGDFIPFLNWIDLQGCLRRSKIAGRKFNAAFQALIDGRREQRGGNYDPPADVLDILLLASLNCPQNIQITDDHIKAALLDIFGGGSDTSAVLIEWALGELLANPIKMKTLEEELETVVGRARRVQESDIPNMPWLRAVVKETMRLHPVVPFLVPRESTKPCQISGYEIPAKTQVYVNTWAIGRDPEAWEKPSEFWPERFFHGSSNVDVGGQHFELLPFGSGRRLCPGRSLGLLNVQLILASLLQAFSWSVEDELDMSEKCGILMSKAKPLVASVTPKLPSRIYEAQK